VSKTPTEPQALTPMPTEGCDCPGCAALVTVKRYVRTAVAEAHDASQRIEERQSIWWMVLEIAVAELAARGVPGGLLLQTTAEAHNEEIEEQQEARRKAGGLAAMPAEGHA
jgi:hypothetical protein